MPQASADGEPSEAAVGRALGFKKGKLSAPLSMPPPIAGESSDEKKADSASLPPARLPSRNASSKYDFVKVKVWLGENADHYYVFSRFLLCRMLTVTKIPNHVAIKIALELKKLLVDNSLLDVSQSDLEANLFKLMERRCYGQEYINRYKMMTRFHHQRVPLVILVCGTACTGKSIIATQLAQRLNLPNVLQTDMVYELLRTSTDAPLTGTPVWAQDFNSSEELITEFCRECRIVRKGLAGDLKKALKDGKPIIIEDIWVTKPGGSYLANLYILFIHHKKWKMSCQHTFVKPLPCSLLGIHLDPSIYLMDEENRNISAKETDSGKSKDESMKQVETNQETASEKNLFRSTDQAENIGLCPNIKTSRAVESASYTEETYCAISNEHAENSSESQGEIHKDSESRCSETINKEKFAAEPIIVPIVLKMAEFDHKALLEEWIATRTFRDKCLIQDQNKLISNLKTIQDYLCSFEQQGLTVVNISSTTFPQTLDWLHGYLLQCIERGVTAEAANNDLGGKDL